MHKIDTPTSHNGSFVDPVHDQGIPGTVADASWLNAVQNEICNAILGSGGRLSKNNNSQLFGAVQDLIDKTCEKNVFEGLSIDTTVGTTAVSIGNAIQILYAEAGWFASASIFIKVKMPAPDGNLTVSFYFKDPSNVEHLLFSHLVYAGTESCYTMPIDISVPYANGSIYFKAVSTASVGVEIIIQGYTSII